MGKKQIRNNDVKVEFKIKTNTNTTKNLTDYYDGEFPLCDVSVYNPIIFFNQLQNWIGDVYRLGKRNNSRWNSEYGYYQQIKHFVSFTLVRSYDEFYSTYHYHIEEKVYIGKYSYSMWKDNSTPNYHRVESNIKTVKKLIEVIGDWLQNWDYEICNDRLVDKLFKPIKEYYHCSDFDAIIRKLDDIDRMLIESDKHIMRKENYSKKENEKINRLYNKGVIDETEYILMGNKIGR